MSPVAVAALLGGDLLSDVTLVMSPMMSCLQARFLLSKVNPSQTHNNMYAWGQVSGVTFAACPPGISVDLGDVHRSPELPS